jgi:hypothetical protein
MSGKSPDSKRRSRPSFIWPILLITVGAIILLSNLGVLGDDIWENIWRFWPVILIAIGLDSLFRRNEIAGPVFMIGLGAVFLLSSLGFIGWGMWDILWRLWPVLLVAVGLEIIIGRRNLWVSSASVILFLVILGGVVWFFGPEQFRGQGLTGDQVEQLLGEVEHAKVVISPSIGDLAVVSLVDSTALIDGEVSIGKNQQVFTNYEVDGSRAYFEIHSQTAVNFPGSISWKWDLGLTDRIPLEVELDMGAGDLNADLSRLTLTNLDISQGVGEVTVALAPKVGYKATISQAIGSVVVEVPLDAGVRIEISRAISSLSMPSDFERRGDFYYSANYDQTENQIDLDISQAIGSIIVRNQ